MTKQELDALHSDAVLLKKYNAVSKTIWLYNRDDFNPTQAPNLAIKIVKQLGYEVLNEHCIAVENRLLEEYRTSPDPLPETYEFIHELEKTIKQASK